MLVGWTLPEMDEFGRSSGLSVKGYKVGTFVLYVVYLDYSMKLVKKMDGLYQKWTSLVEAAVSL